ncbi:MAG: FecR domain-containing protein [Elusimicrobia bacterium]|nr:FecR domain-containing protein [Elusimicrobiota bacterium]
MLPLLLTAVLTLPARAAPPTASIIALEGTVTLTSAGKARPAKKGDAVADGESVAAGPRALAVVEMPDGSRLKLRESTSIKVILSPEPGGASGAFLNSGGLFARVKKGLNRRFSVSTPNAVAAVRGTEFFTAYGREGSEGRDLWVCVGRGAVEVKADASPQAILVKQGEGVLLPGGRRTTQPQFYQWTTKLNWNMDAARGPVADATDLGAAYSDLRDQDYR